MSEKLRVGDKVVATDDWFSTYGWGGKPGEVGVVEGLYDSYYDINWPSIKFNVVCSIEENRIKLASDKEKPWKDPIMEKILFNATLASRDLDTLWKLI